MQGGRQRRVRCVSHPAAPRACRIPRRRVPRRRVRVASRGVSSGSAASVSRTAARRLTSRRRRWCRRRVRCMRHEAAVACTRRAGALATRDAQRRRLHTAGSDQNAARRTARRSARATGQPTRVSDTGARVMAGTRSCPVRCDGAARPALARGPGVDQERAEVCSGPPAREGSRAVDDLRGHAPHEVAANLREAELAVEVDVVLTPRRAGITGDGQAGGTGELLGHCGARW